VSEEEENKDDLIQQMLTAGLATEFRVGGWYAATLECT